ncbi:MAG: glycosyl hydrolase [Bacteroidetes bacterium]|nr:glycosyl hydrolase [Bacteroidota bacterium]
MKKIYLYVAAMSAISLQAQTGLDSMPADVLSVFSFRNIGPATTSGRIVDIAVNPGNHSEYYIAAAYGGVWKTINGGTTFDPIFDGYGTQSIGCVQLDPGNANTVWVGTGENNNQRSVGYGNGVYRSLDGGKSFTNMGLKLSEHIGMIKVDPRNSNVVYVAAYGPVWKEGGERGLYKTEDGGKSWNRVHHVSDQTGCNEVHLDPTNPDILYATFHQRRRHEWTYLGGGPESAVYKSTDAGKTWRKLGSGLPGSDLGRMSLAVCPSDPYRLYLMVEAQDGKGGMFVSNDKGESWTKVNDVYTAGNYYCEIMPDPLDADKVYIMDTYLRWSKDGGKTVTAVGEKWKHVDNHAIWVNPSDTRHLLVGCDGGLYESHDNGNNWDYHDNISITQFYRVTVDNSEPFYNVYGGTQDNNTLGGPVASTSASGVTNADWFVTVGGDGFKSQVDPKDPNIVYSQWQYGGLIRYDRRTGEQVDIKPIAGLTDSGYRWNWDAPLLVSNHSAQRLYFAANKVFRSDDRGNSWQAISGDLSRKLDRNKLPIMDRTWSMDAVAKNQSTSIFGNITFLSESPKDENLLYAGTDDGLIQVTENGGKTWRKMSAFTSIPDMTLVTCLWASRHERNLVYATFDNHRKGDFKPYILKSTDAGKTWTSISSNLPANGSVKTIIEDPVNRDLLFCGTEFGLYISINGGRKWTAWKSGLPPIAIKDIAIQERENDLVVATFGRGFAVADNYAPLRQVTKENLEKDAYIFPVKKARIFVPRTPFGGYDKAYKGARLFTAPNPARGAVIYYHVKNSYKTLKEQRQEREKKLAEAKKNVYYPPADSIRMEAQEEAPFLLFIITDKNNKEVRRLKAPAAKGMGKITWNLCYESTGPLNHRNPGNNEDDAPFVNPGTYKIQLYVVQNGKQTALGAAQTIECDYLQPVTPTGITGDERDQLVREIAELRRRVSGAGEFMNQIRQNVTEIKKAVFVAGLSADFSEKLNALQTKWNNLNQRLNGDGALAAREFETTPGISERVEVAAGGIIGTTNGITQTQKQAFETGKAAFDKWVADANVMLSDYTALLQYLDTMKVPYTPGRMYFLK